MPRKAAPWFRRSAGRWYVTYNGKQTPLPVSDPRDQAGAFAAFQALLTQSRPSCRTESICVLIPEYLSRVGKTVTPKTVRDYAVHLRRLAALYPNRAVSDLTPETLENDAAAQGWSDSHRANYVWTVQAFLRWAGRTDLKLHRPARDSRGPDSVIPPEIHAKVLREATGDFHQLVRLFWAVGCRPMEGARLEAAAIDWPSGTATLKAHKMKRKGQKRILYFSKEALGVLQEQAAQRPTGPLFRGLSGRPFTCHAIVCRFLRISAKIGRNVTAYMYRHTWATRALQAGVPDTQVAAMLGHASTTMLHRHYAHIHADARLLREAAERLAG